MKLLKKIFIILLLIFLFSSLTKNIFNYQKRLKFYYEYKKEYEKEKKRNIALKTEILKKSDLNEIEKTIRNKLNLVKPEETVIILPPPTPTPTVPIPSPLPPFQRWLHLFFVN